MRVLFVDDDLKLLGSIRRMMLTEGDYQPEFVSGGEEALEALEKGSFDVLVADMRMPGMDGATLLEIVQDRYPDVVRVVLSGHSDNHLIMRSIKPAHQFLSKPCSFDEITRTLERIRALRSVFTNTAIRQVVSRIGMLPVFPKAHSELLLELGKEDCSLSRLEQILSRDAGLAAGVLKIVNSAFFGLSRTIKTPAQAVALLGTDLLRGLTVSQGLFSAFDASRYPDFSLNLLWSHCLNTAFFCRAICRESPETGDADEAFNTGLLHDLGKLVLADSLPDEYRRALDIAQRENVTVAQAEQEVLGITHADIGAYLLGLWGFSEATVKAVAAHHDAGKRFEESSGLLPAVHAANVFEHELLVFHEEYARPSLQEAILNDAGIQQEELREWKLACEKVLAPDKDAEG